MPSHRPAPRRARSPAARPQPEHTARLIPNWPQSCPRSPAPADSSGTASTSTWPSWPCAVTACRKPRPGSATGSSTSPRTERAPQKYHHRSPGPGWRSSPTTSMPTGLRRLRHLRPAQPRALDKRLLRRHYRSSTLAAGPARRGWVEPDLAPFPWVLSAARPLTKQLTWGVPGLATAGMARRMATSADAAIVAMRPPTGIFPVPGASGTSD